MSDQELVKAIIRGDNSAMRDLISKYQDLVLNTCYKVLHSREDAEDIAQEVFIETYRSATGLRNEEILILALSHFAQQVYQLPERFAEYFVPVNSTA
ncbi:MAG: sigma factor [Bacteroidales bacterium]|nr:sigma factor [Bacteroidales bacterium]